MKTCISVARVSSREQAEPDRASIPEQFKAIDEWAARYGLKVVDRVSEPGISVDCPLDRELSSRPFWGAYDRLVAGEVSAVIFWRPSRFSRDENALRAGALLEESRAYGLGVCFADQPPPDGPDGGMGQVSSFLRSWASGQDAKNRREAFKTGISAAFKDHRKGRGPDPLGYRWDRMAGRFVEVPDEVEAVRTVFRTYAAEGRGMDRTAELLNERGVPTPSQFRARRPRPEGRRPVKYPVSSRWSGGTLYPILRREAYATGILRGTFLENDRDGLPPVEYEIPVPPIIDRETWDRVQRRRERFSGPKRTDKVRTMLQQLLTCARCGSSIWVHSDVRRGPSARRRGPYEPWYFCKRRIAKGRSDAAEPCDAPRHRSDVVDEAVWKWITQTINRGPAALVELAQAHVRRLEAQIADFSDLLDLDSQLADLVAQRKRAIAAEVKYGEDQTQQVARIEADIGVLEQRRAGRSEDAEKAAGLKADLEATQASLERHGGRFRVYGGGPVDEEDPETALVVYRQTPYLPPDEWVFEGTAAEVISPRELIEELGLRVALDADQAVISGVISAVIPLSDGTGELSSLRSSPPAPRRR